MSLTPFEIRLELLKMARDLLTDEYHTKSNIDQQNWLEKVATARSAGSAPPDHPGMATYPNETDIITKATTLNGFVSQLPPIDSKKPKGA